MSAATAEERRAEVELAAAARLLALAFGEPDAEALAEMGALADGLLLGSDPGAREDESLRELAAALADAGPDDLAPEHDALFGVEGACQAYEGSYERDPIRQSRQMADAAGFYRAFGADAGGTAAERPDHAGCQLEFLSFLALRRLAALDAGEREAAEICRRAEDAFLADHVLRWLPALARDVAAHASTPFYASLARAAADRAALEASRRGLDLPPPPARRERSARGEWMECGGVPLR